MSEATFATLEDAFRAMWVISLYQYNIRRARGAGVPEAALEPRPMMELRGYLDVFVEVHLTLDDHGVMYDLG